MKKIKHTDLSQKNPGPRADPDIEPRITSETTFTMPGGFEFSTSSDAPARGPGGIASAVLLLSVGGTLGVLGIAALGAAASAPGWLMITLAPVVFGLVVVGGLILIGRHDDGQGASHLPRQNQAHDAT